jgi:glutaredoxin
MWGWLTGSGGTARDVVMYTRAGCHLCDEAWGILETERARTGFTLTRIDVDTDPSLAERFGLEVPVVVIDGRVHFRGRVNPVLLRRLLA